MSQVQNIRLYLADSLPVGTDISKVAVNISSEGYYIFVEAGENDSIWSDSDSLDFTNPVKFKVLSEMNTFGHIYTAQIDVHQQDPDIMSWTKLAKLGNNIKTPKAVYANENIFVFTEGNTQVAVTSTKDGKEWTSLQTIDLPTKADYNSAIEWAGKIYILADKALYSSENGINWTKIETEQTFNALIASFICASVALKEVSLPVFSLPILSQIVCK